MTTLENHETKVSAEYNDITTHSIQNHKKLLIGIIVAVVAILSVLIFLLLDIVNDVKLTNHVQRVLNGKTYIEENMTFSRVYTFNGDTLGKEDWHPDAVYTDAIYGDINNDYPYKVNGSLLKNKMEIEFLVDGYWCTGVSIELCEDGSVKLLYGDWKETTIDEINTLRKTTLCDHKYGSVQLVQKATCSGIGEEKQICSICGYEQITEIEKLEHKYVNKICSECGAKKQPQKAYDIEANTWYTYQDVLHFQNIKIRNAFSVSQGKGMSVSYNFICQHCHVVDETWRTNVPEYNYDINKIFTCTECGGFTTVKIKLG